MSDSHTEVTYTSWFQRITDSLKGVLFGLVLILISVGVLWWNEGRSVTQYKTIDEGRGQVQIADSGTVDPATDGKLVYMTGKADTDEELEDAAFGVKVTAISLRRIVEMYQWKESSSTKKKKKIGGGTQNKKTYTYSKTWSSSVIDSNGFNQSTDHKNPKQMKFEPRSSTAQHVTLGAHKLSRSLIQSISGTRVLTINKDTLSEDLKASATISGDYLVFGADSSSPKIGDTRVKLVAVDPTDVSVVSKQVKDSFEPFKTESGGDINWLRQGTVGVDEMFTMAEDDNALMTWILRGAGFIAMFIGCCLILSPLVVVADIMPIIGSIVGLGTSLASFAVSALLTLATVSIAWLFYRPLLSLCLILPPIALIMVMKMKGKKT